MPRTHELKDDPRLPLLIARAIATGGSRKGGDLPDLVVVRRGVSAGAGQLAAYDRVCGFTLRDTLPSTYLQVLTAPLQAALFVDGDYPYPVVGSVHVENRITQHRPVRVGESIRLSVRAQNQRRHHRGALVDVVGQARVGDELVWEGLSTYLYRDAQAPGEVPPRTDEPEAVDGAGSLWRLPADLGRRYAAVSGDYNPIHLSSVTAKALGFPRAIVHGMWAQARVLAALENRLPEAYAAQVSFRKPLLLPSTVRFVARPDAPQTGWDVSVRNQRKGDEHLRGWVGPVVPQ